MRVRVVSIALCVGLGMACAPGAARAQASPPSPAPATAADAKAIAITHYQLGIRLYNLGEYAKARDEFKTAYLAKDDPAFLYNLGQCARLLGEYEEAIQRYRAYLRERPNAPNRREVEQLIANAEKTAELKRQTATSAPGALRPREETGAAPIAAPLTSSPPVAPPTAPIAAAAPPPPPAAVAAPAAASPGLDLTPREAAPARPVYRRWWFWTAIGVAVVGGAVAAVVATTVPRDASIPSSALGDMRLP